MSKAEFEFDAPTALPDGWRWVPLEELMDEPKQDIVDGPFGSNLKASEYVDEGVPIARLQNVGRNVFVHKKIKFLTQEKADELSRHTFRPGDILITKLGDPLGEACLAPPFIKHGVIVADLVRVRPAENKIDRRYLTYVINSPLVARQFEKHTKGTTRPRVNLGMIRKLPIPVAPRDVQPSVVAEIEKQFSRLDEAVANLNRVKANLKRYKSAVLKAAVEGLLVEIEAEISHREGRSYETGTQLLQRILETRRSEWKGKGKYKEPVAPDTTDLPELPEGWVWASVDQLLASLRNGLSRKPEDSEPGIPILRISAVRPLELDANDTRFYRLEASEHADAYKLEIEDVLFVRYNGNKEFVGACALVRAVSGMLLYPDKLIRGRVVGERQVLPGYLAIAANVGESRQHIDELIKTTAGQQGISGGEIKQMPLPLPPHAEQARIVAEVDRRLSLLRKTETQVDLNLRRAERLRQSVLGGAFSGELVNGVTERVLGQV